MGCTTKGDPMTALPFLEDELDEMVGRVRCADGSPVNVPEVWRWIAHYASRQAQKERADG